MAANLEKKIQKTLEGKELTLSEVASARHNILKFSEKEKYEDLMLISRLENAGFPQASCSGVETKDPEAEICEYFCKYTGRRLSGKMICIYCITPEKAENCKVYKAHED